MNTPDLAGARQGRAVLLDLDGTLTDSRPGIVASYHAALRSLGHEPDPAIDLTFVIGPPPEVIMTKVLAHYGDDRVGEAVTLYRDHYGRDFIFDNSVYDGIPAALDRLAGAGFVLYVATAKRTVFARRILERFGLAARFAGIYGSEPGGALDRKVDLIRHLLAAEALSPAAAVMVGDRSHDIEGAHANGLPAIGVAWGYGGADELRAHRADRIIDRPDQLADAVLELTAVRA
jgi:phosphoglycolate phosphatase